MDKFFCTKDSLAKIERELKNLSPSKRLRLWILRFEHGAAAVSHSVATDAAAAKFRKKSSRSHRQ